MDVKTHTSESQLVNTSECSYLLSFLFPFPSLSFHVNSFSPPRSSIPLSTPPFMHLYSGRGSRVPAHGSQIVARWHSWKTGYHQLATNNQMCVDFREALGSGTCSVWAQDATAQLCSVLGQISGTTLHSLTPSGIATSSAWSEEPRWWAAIFSRWCEGLPRYPFPPYVLQTLVMN